MQRAFRRGGDKIAYQPGQKRWQIGDLVAHLGAAVQRVLKNSSEIPREHIREDRRAFDHSGVAKACLLAGEWVPVDQDHVPSPPLQVQDSTDADHARTQYENIRLELRHPALLLSVMRLRS